MVSFPESHEKFLGVLSPAKMGYNNSTWSETMCPSHQNVPKREPKQFKRESQMKDLPQFVPFPGNCAGGICALRRMCLVLRNSPDSQDVPLASGYNAVPSGMLTVGHWQAELVRNECPGAALHQLQMGSAAKAPQVSQHASLNFPKCPNKIQYLCGLLFIRDTPCSEFLSIFILSFHSPVTFPGMAFLRLTSFQPFHLAWKTQQEPCAITFSERNSKAIFHTALCFPSIAIFILSILHLLHHCSIPRS